VPRKPKSKFTKKKFNKRKTGRKLGKKTLHVNTGTTVIYNHPKYPLPPTLFTTFESILQGTVAGGAAATQNFGVLLNGCHLPWASFGVSTGNPIQFPTPISYTTAALAPQGWSNIANSGVANTSGLYQYYKVYRADIELRFNPVNSSDQVTGAIIPYLDAVPTANIQQGYADPDCVYKSFTTAESKPLRKKMMMHKYFGVTRDAYMSDQSGYFNAASNGNPVRLLSAMISYQTNDNGALGNTPGMGYMVRVRYYVKLYAEYAFRFLAI